MNNIQDLDLTFAIRNARQCSDSITLEGLSRSIIEALEDRTEVDILIEHLTKNKCLKKANEQQVF